MITVERIIWLEPSGEAKVVLSDEKYYIAHFCSNCTLSVGDTFSDTSVVLSTLES